MRPKIGVIPNRKGKIATDYLEKIKTAGGDPVALPLSEFREPLLRALKKVRGVLLPGGGDFSEDHYPNLTTEKARSLKDLDPMREEAEWLALDFARDSKIPVFGICRGMQAMNLHAGGTLMADIELELRGDEMPEHRSKGRQQGRGPDHDVLFDPESLLGKVANLASDAVREKNRVKLRVNNSHHQAILKVGRGLRVSGWAPDGVIEAVETDLTAPVLWFGVQFHPERMNNDFASRLFELFIKTVKQGA